MLFSPTRKQPDRYTPCQGARRLLLFVLCFCLLFSTIIAADLFLRVPGDVEDAARWMRVLSLSSPALWIAGNPLRHPETTHPGVDLRFSPGLELFQ